MSMKQVVNHFYHSKICDKKFKLVKLLYNLYRRFSVVIELMSWTNYRKNILFLEINFVKFAYSFINLFTIFPIFGLNYTSYILKK